MSAPSGRICLCSFPHPPSIPPGRKKNHRSEGISNPAPHEKLTNFGSRGRPSASMPLAANRCSM